jgi:hypothetical protein
VLGSRPSRRANSNGRRRSKVRIRLPCKPRGRRLSAHCSRIEKPELLYSTRRAGQVSPAAGQSPRTGTDDATPVVSPAALRTGSRPSTNGLTRCIGASADELQWPLTWPRGQSSLRCRSTISSCCFRSIRPTLVKYREAFQPSGAKSDPKDAGLALDLLLHHPDRFAPLRPPPRQNTCRCAKKESDSTSLYMLYP